MINLLIRLRAHLQKDKNPKTHKWFLINCSRLVNQKGSGFRIKSSKSCTRRSLPEVFCKKGVLKNFKKFTGKHLCQSLFIKKETLAKVFSCEFCEIFRNIYFYRTPLVAASVYLLVGQVS